MSLISDRAAHRLRTGWIAWRHERYACGRATALAWIEHGNALPEQVYRVGAAATAGVFSNVEELSEPASTWKWIVGPTGEFDSNTPLDEGEEADRFWASLGVTYDEYFAAGFIAAIGDAYREVFRP